MHTDKQIRQSTTCFEQQNPLIMISLSSACDQGRQFFDKVSVLDTFSHFEQHVLPDLRTGYGIIHCIM